MDNIAVSRQNLKKGNKENAQPANGYKSFIKSGKTSAAPLPLKSNKEKIIVKNGPTKSKAKLADTRSETEQRDGNVAAAADAKVAQVPKTPAPLPSSKSALGMYKGKIIQSKIGSIWKSSAAVSGADLKPENQRAGNVTKRSSESTVHLPGHGTQKPAQMRSRSLLDRGAQVSKPAVTSRRPVGSGSARPPARIIPATQTTTSSRNTSMAFKKRNGAQSSKPKILDTEKQVNKPPVSTYLGQYRLRMETEEVKRAKLAEWLASKGKTLKRPAMRTAAPSKTTASAKPEAVKPKPQQATQCNPEPEPRLEAPEPGLAAAAAAAHCADTQRAQLTTHSQTAGIIDTSFDLLDNSDADLPVDPQGSVDDIVVNLCAALEAMDTPSTCNDELSQATGACSDAEVGGSIKDERNNEMSKDVDEQLKVEQAAEEAEETDEVESDDDDCVTETTPQMEGASLIKYNVKTTPYLQSFKRTIAEEGNTNASRRKSNIRDLKYLTPVRRSCRIQRNSSHLPTMLLDHDPCVSSLAELVKLDDSNAYIYRKNPTLLEDMPDQEKE